MCEKDLTPTKYLLHSLVSLSFPSIKRIKTMSQRSVYSLMFCILLISVCTEGWMSQVTTLGPSLARPLAATSSSTTRLSPVPPLAATSALSDSDNETSDISIVPPGEGLYKPFADNVWRQWQATGWFEDNDDDDGARTRVTTQRVAVAKGFPPGSRVRMTIQSMVGRPHAPVAFARYALLETLVAALNETNSTVPESTRPQHQGIQVLNAVVIPRADSVWPVWGADFVALPGNKHLLLLDAQPMVPNDTKHESFENWYAQFDIASEWPWAGDLPPEVQPYVSPKALWTRLGGGGGGAPTPTTATTTTCPENDNVSPTEKIATRLLPAMEAHLQSYLHLIQQQPMTGKEEETENWLRPYLEYRLAKDPARPMLQALYGKEWTENVLESILFPLDLLFGQKNKDGDDDNNDLD